MWIEELVKDYNRRVELAYAAHRAVWPLLRELPGEPVQRSNGEIRAAVADTLRPTIRKAFADSGVVFFLRVVDSALVLWIPWQDSGVMHRLAKLNNGVCVKAWQPTRGRVYDWVNVQAARLDLQKALAELGPFAGLL